ncbi:MAG: hypothetical protein OXI27_09705 [Thaumarchaeota archaeon]|nr:hypothetical protein [Nitrososphaerota archaeon]
MAVSGLRPPSNGVGGGSGSSSSGSSGTCDSARRANGTLHA